MNNASFEKEFYLRTSDFDCRMELQPSAVLDLFQDVAGEHARALGIGREAMLAEKLLWVHFFNHKKAGFRHGSFNKSIFIYFRV